MKQILNKLPIAAFDIIANLRGYRFTIVTTEKEYADANRVFDAEGFSFPPHLDEDVQRFKKGTVNFVAYYRGTPVGMVRLANPKIINRAYEHYGVDREAAHHEIQSLIVRKEYRDGAQFVMLGLIKELYVYSVARGIDSWSACGKRNVYMTMRKYCKGINVIDIDFKNITHPVTQYLYAHNMVETYFIMDVNAFAPWQIFKKCVKKLLKSKRHNIQGGNAALWSVIFKKWGVHNA